MGCVTISTVSTLVLQMIRHSTVKIFTRPSSLWGGWNVGKKFQFLAFVPVNHNYQNSDDGIAKLTGLGDATVLANYKLIDESSVGSQGSLFSQQLWVGGGVKLNTGKFDIENGAADIAAAANRQLGSGSIDLLLNAIYNVQIDKFGISTTASYKINSANKYQYRFGDKLSASSFVYYPISVPNVLISPNLGILYEKTQPSELQNSKIDLTAGTILEGSVGLEISFNKTTFGFSAQLPLAQNFAENQTHSRVKGMAHMSFAF